VLDGEQHGSDRTERGERDAEASVVLGAHAAIVPSTSLPPDADLATYARPVPGDLPTIRLQPTPAARSLVVGGPAEHQRAEVTGALAELLHRPAAVLLTSACSTALEAVATLVPLGLGDEVVVPAYGFPTAVAPFASRGATIRFADVDPATLNVDPTSVLERLGPRTRAVVVMHYGGVAVDDAPWAGTAAEHGASVVEDAAHGIFAAVGGQPLGTLGRFGALSFHRTKNLSAHDGGALVVNRPEDVEAALVAIDKGTDRVRFDAGQVRSYEWQGLGGAWRMGDAEVAYLAAELAEGADRQARRHRAWSAYAERLLDWAHARQVALPSVPGGVEHPAHQFHLVLPDAADRPAFVEHLGARGVQAARHYSALTATPFGRTLHQPSDRCPVAEELAPRLVRIPLHHQLDDAAIDRVVSAVTAWDPR
jgi:dTDP-4-amino-4,6-dideoxygalactose transaminase